MCGAAQDRGPQHGAVDGLFGSEWHSAGYSDSHSAPSGTEGAWFRRVLGSDAHAVAAATPAHRDRHVDLLRAVAILAVVTGHWLAAAVIVLACLAGLTGLAGTSFAGLSPATVPIVELTALAAGLLLVGLRMPIIGRLRARRR